MSLEWQQCRSGNGNCKKNQEHSKYKGLIPFPEYSSGTQNFLPALQSSKKNSMPLCLQRIHIYKVLDFCHPHCPASTVLCILSDIFCTLGTGGPANTFGKNWLTWVSMAVIRTGLPIGMDWHRRLVVTILVITSSLKPWVGTLTNKQMAPKYDMCAYINITFFL